MRVEREFWAAMESGMDEVQRRLGSDDRALRLGAAWLLCARSFGSPELPTSGQRQVSLIGLILTHEVRGLEVLAQDDPAPNVRAEAVSSLARLVEHDHPSVTLLLAKLSIDDDEERVRIAAIEAMAARCPGQRHTPVARAWLWDRSDKVRCAAIAAHRTWGTPFAELMNWLASDGEDALALGLECLETQGAQLQWREVPSSVLRGAIAIRAKLLRVFAEPDEVPLNFWLGCACECHWLHEHAAVEFARVADRLGLCAARRDAVDPADVPQVTSAREVAGQLVRAIGPRAWVGRRSVYYCEADPMKKIGFEVFSDLAARLWQALTELDPTFDPEGDEVVEHLRRHMLDDDWDYPSGADWLIRDVLE